jgi:hypothetical protein
MKNEILVACDYVVGAVINGAYQGIIVTALVALGLRLFGRSNAATRYAVWLCVLLLLPFLIVIHAWHNWQSPAKGQPDSFVAAALDQPIVASALESLTFTRKFRLGKLVPSQSSGTRLH